MSRRTQHLSNRTRWFYGVGSVAFGVKDAGFSYFLLLYYNQVLGLPSHLASTAIFVALLLDALSDPIVGVWSDRLRTRWGRRHPFMYGAAVPVGVSYYLLWNPPELGENGLFWYLLLNAVAVRSVLTFYEVPSTALAPELTVDYDERTRLAGLRHVLGWVGGLAISMFTYLFLLVPTAEQPVGQLNAEGYRTAGLLGAVAMATAILVSAAGTHDRIPRLRMPPARGRRSLAATFAELRETLTNRSFFAVFGFGVFAAMAGGLGAAMNIYLSTYFWGLSAMEIGLIVPSGLVAAAAALVAAPALSRGRGKKRAAIEVSLLATLVAPAPIVLRLFDMMPANGTVQLLMWLVAHNVATVALIIVSTSLVSAMMADVVEESELATGRRSEGVFFAARSFIAKSMAGLGVVSATLLLGAVGFPARAQPGAVDADVIFRLGAGYAPMVIGLQLAAVACLLGYRISRERHDANVRELDSRRLDSDRGIASDGARDRRRSAPRP